MYYATAQEMEQLDKLAVEHGLEIRQMMELAGWHMAELFEILRIPTGSRAVIVCGVGNKGGDGLSAARHLVNHGWHVEIVLMSRDIAEDAAHHLRLLEQMEVPIVEFGKDRQTAELYMGEADILVDALIGYHLHGNPRGDFAEAIEEMNSTAKKIIAYDLPSGLDPTTGRCFSPCIRAYATLSLALPKKAFEPKEARTISGRVFVADIGIPQFLYDKIAPGSRPAFEDFDDFFLPVA